MIDTELYGDDPFRCWLLILLKVVQKRWFFQFVLVSGRQSLSISYLMLLSMISCNVSPS